VLLTGATGFLGTELLVRWLERTDRRIVLLVRAKDAGEARGRVRGLLAAAVGDAAAYGDRVTAVPGDLTRPGLGVPGGWDALADEVTEIVHGAASVSFGLSLAASRAVNAEGTRRMLDLAARCARRGGGLRRFSYISTAYVAGDRSGLVGEEELRAGLRFRNAYEQSKHEAERLVRANAARLPVTVLRPSIVVGDARTGWTSSFNVMYAPLRAFSLGAFPILPARRRSPVDIVSVDYVADAIFALAGAQEAEGRTYHLTAAGQATCVAELLELAARRFEVPVPRLVSPRLYRRVVRPVLVRRHAASGRGKRLLRSEVYFPYFAMRLRFDDAQARSALDPLGLRPAPVSAYFDRIVDFALAARWGRAPVARVQAMRERGREPALAAA
jgi:thioester reductase-like protein